MLIEIPDDIPAITLARFAAENGCTFAPTLNDRIMLKLVRNSDHEVAYLAKQIKRITTSADNSDPAVA